MNVKIKRIDKSIPLPRYETSGAVGFDLLCRKSVEVLPQNISLVPANVIIETPPGYMLLVALRSSTPRKRGLLIPHGIGVIDRTIVAMEMRFRFRSIISPVNPS